MFFLKTCLLFFLLIASCLDASFYKNTVNHLLVSKEQKELPLYSINLPKCWQRLALKEQASDQISPLASFKCGNSLLNVYHFPQKAPLEAYVNRLIKKLNASFEETSINPFSCGGFSGLLLWAENGERAVFAASISLDEEMASALQAKTPSQKSFSSFSVSLKAIGPRDELFALKTSLEKSYRSFRLQKEVHKLL